MEQKTSMTISKQEMLKQIDEFKSTLIKNQWDELDNKTFKTLLQRTMSQLEKTELYNENKDVYSEYEEVNHAMSSIYTYLYDQRNSNLTSKDAKIFASYLATKIKSMKNVIEKIDWEE